MDKRILQPLGLADLKKCASFAQKCVLSNLNEYEKRGQGNVSKVALDIEYGKRAELMVYYYVKAKELPCTYPDFAIYLPNEKSFDADLLQGEYKVHVKSCLASSKFPNSWLFQPNDHLVTRPQKNELLALCVLDGNDGYFYLMNATKAVYGDPIKRILDKKVIYEKEL